VSSCGQNDRLNSESIESGWNGDSFEKAVLQSPISADGISSTNSLLTLKEISGCH
jgi:hypothetical protein